MWKQGQYFAKAIQSTIYFGKGTPPEYPQMPFEEENDEELAKDDKWLESERLRAYNHFMAILNKK